VFLGSHLARQSTWYWDVVYEIHCESPPRAKTGSGHGVQDDFRLTFAPHLCSNNYRALFALEVSRRFSTKIGRLVVESAQPTIPVLAGVSRVNVAGCATPDNPTLHPEARYPSKLAFDFSHCGVIARVRFSLCRTRHEQLRRVREATP
jgi:hypothetical protein